MAPLAVSFASTVSGGSGGYAYSWNFGDGSAPATTATASHTYAGGSYTAVLTVTDASSAKATSSVTVSVRPTLVVSASASPSQGAAPLLVNFTSTASGGSNSGYAYSWDFGDGTAGSGAAPSHSYTTGGTYTATVTVTDSAADTGTATATVSPLSVDLSATPTSGNFPLNVSLTASPCGGTGTYASYVWTFGDGTAPSTTTASTVAHTYAGAGTYSASVKVTDSAGITAASSAVTITATVPPLTATATATPTSGLAPVTVSLGGTASGGVGPYTYGWDFGDGSPASSGQSTPAASWTYQVPGTFTATLTVKDSQTPTPKTTTATVSITAKPPVPAISMVSPPFGPETGGTSVSISGTYFENASAVKFGTRSGTIVSNTCDASANCTLVATSPAAPAGPVNITITTPGGTTPATNDQFTYDLAWTSLAATGPLGREGAAMINDGSEVMLFGGSNGLADLADTWLWNGTAWTASAQVTAPSGRANAAVAYDSAHSTVVLFGGSCSLLGILTCPLTNLNDTWEWSAATKTWTQAQAAGAAGSPSARSGAMMAFDSSSRVILFGGFDGTNYLNDTWAFNFNSGKWTQLNASNCASTSLPSCRDLSAIGRDASGQVVLFGGENSGTYLSDTWTWNGSAWSSYSLSGPSARSMAAMGYYNKPGGGTATGLVLFGGRSTAANCPSGVCGDTWTWSSGRWENLYATGSAGSPSARYNASAATDTGGGVLLYGGNSGSAELADTHLIK